LELLGTYPEDPRLLAMLARLNAETKRITFSEAEDTVKALLVEHPQHERLRVALALLAIRQGRRDEGFSMMEDLAAQGDTAYVHEIYAGLLQAHRATLNESWDQYKIAVRPGPLSSPCFRSAAYRVGRRVARNEAAIVLKGVRPLERAVLHTRSLGPITLFLIFDVLGFAALGTRLAGPLGWSLALMTLATLWAGWAVYCNHLVCCKRCRNYWIGYPVPFWLLFALTPAVIKGPELAILGVACVASNVLVLVRQSRREGIGV
jgi:hypothetical protein